MKQTIRLNESELNRLIEHSVKQVLRENEEDEGWFGDKWNQAKSAWSTATQSGDKSLGQRFNQARQNWNTQGDLNGLNNLMQQLSDFVDNGQLNPQMTIAQLIGGKYNGGKFGRMSAMIGNRRSQVSRRGGTAY